MAFVLSCTHFFVTLARTFFQSSALTAKLKGNMSKLSFIVNREESTGRKEAPMIKKSHDTRYLCSLRDGAVMPSLYLLRTEGESCDQHKHRYRHKGGVVALHGSPL